MGKSAVLAIKLIGDATNAVKAMDDAATATERMQGRLTRVSAVSGAVTSVIAKGMLDAGQAASELEQSTGSLQAVFGSSAQVMQDWADNAARNVGLSANEASTSAAIIGSQLKNMGVDAATSATMTQDLIAKGADMAAVFGGSATDAVDAISSALRGERDPIERYGVSLNQASIDAWEAAHGLTGLTGTAKTAADMQASLALINDQTAQTTGQWAAQAGTAAEQQQIMNKSVEDASAKLGTVMLPILVTVTGWLANFASFVEANAGWLGPLAIAIGVVAAAITVLSVVARVYAGVQAVQTAAQWAMNAAWLANPVVIIVGLIIGALVLLAMNWETVSKAAVDAWGAITKAAGDFFGWFGGVATEIGHFFSDIGNGAVNAFRAVVDWIGRAIDSIKALGRSVLPGWVSSLLGINTGSSAASTANGLSAMIAPAALAATMSVTAFAAPAAITATPTPTAITSSSSSVTNITVDGAIDPVATGDRIADILDDRDRRQGRKPAASNRSL